MLRHHVRPHRRLVFAFYCNCVLEIDWMGIGCILHVILVNIIQTKADVIPYLSPLLRATSSDPIDKSPTPWIRPQPYIPHNLAFDSIIN